MHTWVRVDAFLAEKYHYTPQEISQLTPTECLWLCVHWAEAEGEQLAITEGMDASLAGWIMRRQQQIINARLTYARLSPDDKLDLATRSIYSEHDYTKHVGAA